MSSYQRSRAAGLLAASATGACVALFVGAAPAAADTASFLAALEDRHTSWTSQELSTAGHTACSMIERGTPASEVTDHLDRERGFGVALAFDIVSAAVVHLGC
ncbi:DUF732 domain-containing protein [Mycolicibacterium hippocampi]|uniref:DUF732 domain-containing protein n=1 Tax=Mycolicibacterium hippocampi TaxID=659824 RepID=A0A7I9ZL28_9MYCO|nr:DUF732 domain-containing protein [Mycolicibacterium hippocampi]GFH01509.1 hypothetical protein MHIP_19920 [Mycolicibacterium hippocampi]